MKRAISARIVVGLALVATLPAFSIDDYFRVYHAMFWWERPAFANSTHWLPLYAWVQGSLIGLFDESRFVPRLASLTAGLIGSWFGSRDATTDDERTARVVLASVLPTSVLLFASPLTEAGFGALIAVHVASVARYREHARIADALAASLTLLAATSLRYEAWVVIPFSAALLLTRPAVDARRSIGAALALLPLAFPLRWFDHVAERTGHAESFLDAIAGDQFGASPITAFASPAALGVSLAFVATTFVSLGAALSSEAPTRVRIHSAYGVGFSALLVALAVVGQLPSQLPIRLVHVPMLLSVPALVFATRGAVARLAIVSIVSIALGLCACLLLPSVRSPSDVALSARLRTLLGASPTSVAVVEGEFPEITQFVADSSAPSRVFVEGTGGRCRLSVAACEFPCGRPAWTDRLRYAIATSSEFADRLRELGFRAAARSGDRILFERPVDSSPVCPSVGGGPS